MRYNQADEFERIKEVYKVKLEQIKDGEEFWRNIVGRLCFKKKDLIIVLSKDSEQVNLLVMKYLPEIKEKYQADRLIIFGNRQEDYRFMTLCTIGNVMFYCMNEHEASGLNTLLRLYKFTDRIIYSSSKEITDKDSCLLIDSGEITLEDIVAIAVFGLDRVPEPKEINASEVKVEKVSMDSQNEKNHEELNIFQEDNMIEQLQGLILSNNITCEDEIVIFGANKNVKFIKNVFDNYKIHSVIDNDKRKRGTFTEKIEINTPDEVLARKDKVFKVIIASRYYEDMLRQIEGYGYEVNKNVFVVDYNFFDNRLMDIKKYVDDFEAGYNIYCDLLEKFPETYFFYNKNATGNTYLLGLYLREYIKANGINKYIVLNAKKSTDNICGLFGLNSMHFESKEQVRSLWRFARVMKNENVGFREMCPYDKYTNLIKMRAYKGMDFGTIYRRVLYDVKGIPDKERMLRLSSELFFCENNLRQGRTVLLAPYANTVGCIDDEFWGILAKRLSERGFDVCTNCGPNEEAIKGTLKVCISYNMVIDFVDKAGFFIGVRSGLCDILSATKAKMIIIYPEDGCGSSIFDYNYFSIEKMQLRKENMLEIFDADEECVMKKILCYLQ